MNESRLKKLCDTYGVEWDVPATSQPLRAKGPDQIAHGMDGVDKDKVRRMFHDDGPEGIGSEVGEPGTPFGRDGQVTPPVGKYGARTVRGTHGRWGLYEEMYQSEVQIYDPVNTISEALRAASYEVQPPNVVNDDHESAVEEFVDWTNAWLHSIDGGIKDFVRESAETLLIYGPCVHEVVWGVDDRGWKHPTKFGYREPSTIDEYVLTESQNGLAAIEFYPDDGERYLLRNGSDLKRNDPKAAPTRKLIHAAYHQRGNNFDGVPPTRPAIVYKKLKELLIQIAGLTADKYGVPIPKVMDAPVEVAEGWEAPEGTADDGDKDKLFQNVKRMRAGQAPVAKIPSGLDLEYEAPPGEQATVRDLLEYCDQQQAQGFKNEGALIAQSGSVGSYAIGEVKDNQFLRKAPAVAQMALAPINDLIRLTAQAFLEPHLETSLPDYPKASVMLGVETDVSSAVEDFTQLMGNQPATRWPEGVQEQFLEITGMPADMFERSGEGETDVGGTAEDEDGAEPDNVEELPEGSTPSDDEQRAAAE